MKEFSSITFRFEDFPASSFNDYDPSLKTSAVQEYFKKKFEQAKLIKSGRKKWKLVKFWENWRKRIL